jgi:putative transcriptional regulator
MSKRAYDKIAKGLEQAIAFADGATKGAKVNIPPEIDVKSIRRSLRLSQVAFGARFGFSAAIVRDWEQGRAQPTAAARTLLLVIAREPEAVDRALDPHRTLEPA